LQPAGVDPFPRLALAGQAALVPVQYSGASQANAAARQSVVFGAKTSPGQAALVPVQYSSTSQPPAAAARHCVEEGLKPFAGQVALVPVQLAATSQTPAATRQIVLDGKKPSAGQVVEVPSHDSAMSQPPAAAARHTVPAVFGLTWHVCAASQVLGSAQASAAAPHTLPRQSGSAQSVIPSQSLSIPSLQLVSVISVFWQDVHAPALQLWPPVHAGLEPHMQVPPVAQVSEFPTHSALPQQLATGMQEPLHSLVVPAGHWHAFATQSLPPVQSAATQQPVVGAQPPAVHAFIPLLGG
jgi:hypothetical protein